ncbi:MAG TPA: hypothetical protein VFP55_04020 [Solirubrobacteraceae bacterium]|nr:hypothetical protein [Solirubrobacteraceae bacterium]
MWLRVRAMATGLGSGGRWLISLVLVCAGLAGCGFGSPQQTARPGTRAPAESVRAGAGAPAQSVVARATTSRELPTPPGVQSAPGALSAAAAVTAFAEAYINWNYRDVAARMEMLARASIGQARSAMTLTAARTRTDPSLAEAGLSNRGTVEAVAPLTGGGGRYAVVTREVTQASRTTAYEGLAPSWHVALATVTVLGPPGRRRWVLSAWQPES